MRLLLPGLTLAAFLLAGCAAKRAAADCETMGYTPGTDAFTQCAERQVAARREAFRQMQERQKEIAIECERASHSGIFGRNTGRQDCPR
jgi:hypothetical protein